jgi:hypothetical protein
MEDAQKMRISWNSMIAAFFGFSFVVSPAQDGGIARYDHLREPKISTRKSQKVIVVEAVGDPNIVGGKAFGLLFQLYYSSPDTPKGTMQGAPRARWPSSETDRTRWLGLYALPVPDTMTSLPDYRGQEGLKVSLVNWDYGEVAEILHLGPYDKEEPTMERLRSYVKSHGYSIVGGHEEEYIRGPGMSGPGDPEKYVTIIRYRLKKT